MKRFLLVLIAIAYSFGGFSQKIGTPVLTQQFDDAGEILKGYESKIKEKLALADKATGSKIYLLTAYSYAPQIILNYADGWKASKNKGILIAINPWDKFAGNAGNWDKNARIEVSADLESKLPAEVRQIILKEVMTPLLDQKDLGDIAYYTAIMKGLEAVMARWNKPPVILPTLVFAKNEDPPLSTIFGFDAKTNDALAKYYNTVPGKTAGKLDYIPWKSVESNKSTAVDVIIRNNFDLKSLTFTTKDGASFIPVPTTTEDRYKLILNGGSEGDVKEVIASYATSDTTKVPIAQLNVVAYDKARESVVIVPLPGAVNIPSIGDISKKLNEVYGQAVADWDVKLADYTPEDWDAVKYAKIESGEGGLLSNYASEMRSINKAFKRHYPSYNENTYYIFLAGESEVQDLAGYMPRAKQFGYVFTKGQSSIAKTIAHELGHGAFHLKHTFEETAVSKGGSGNLMDYNEGVALNKYQWDFIHDPVTVIGILEKEEDAASVTVINIEELKGWEYNDVAYAFLAPSGEVVLVPKTIKSLKFSTGDIANSKEENIVKIVPFGTLLSFNIDGKIYESLWNEEKNIATRYATKDKQSYIITDHIPLDKLDKPIDKVIIGIPQFSQGGFLYRVQLIENTFTDIKTVKSNGYSSRGLFKEFDFLNKYYSTNTNVRTLSAPPSFFNNQNAVNFIQFYLGKETGQGNNPSYSLYLYTHATLLDKYGLLGGCFATGLPSKFLKDIEKFYYTVTSYNAKTGMPYQVTQSIAFPEEFELNKETMLAFKYLMSKWSNVDVNYYKELEKLVNSFKAIKIPAVVTDGKTDELLGLFSTYNDLNTDNFNCIFSELSAENKRNFLKHLLSTQDDDWGNKYEKITLKLLESLTNEEVLIVFQDFKTNPKLLYNAYNKLDNLFNSEYIMRFMYGIFYGWKQSNGNVKTIYPELAGINKEKTTAEDFKLIANHPKVILLEDEKVFTGTESDLILKTSWNKETSKIAILQNADYLNSYGKMLIDLYSINASSLFEGKSVKNLENLNPLDPVVIFISKQNATDSGLQLDPGIYAVPAILIYWVNSTQKSEVKQFYLRIALDALAVALAPLSGGGSLALITLEIALPAIDIALTLTKEQLSKDSNETFFKIYNYWDKAYMTYGVALAGVGLFKSAPSLLTGAKNTMRLVANPKVAGKLIRAKTLTKLEELKNLDLKKLADNIEELSKAILKNYGAQWSNYGYELKNLANSIRLNAELRYVSFYNKLEGIVNSESSFMITNSDSYSKLFKYQYNEGILYASDIRFLRNNSSNVKRIKFAGELENIHYTDNGKSFTGFYIVEDLDNPNSFFALTEKEINSGGSGIDNFDEVVKDYRAFKGINVSSAVKKLDGKAYSESILWKNIDETNIIWSNPNNNAISTAKSFANEVGTSFYDVVLNNGFYVKFDLSDGRILLGNTNGNYHAFAVINDNVLTAFKSSVLTTTNEVFNIKLSQFLSTNADKLKILSGVVSKELLVAGTSVTFNTNKVNTLLGRFRPDVANLFEELGSFKNVGLGETKGGINILNKPDYYYDATSWWDAYNKPWLNKAMQRGDDIYLATIPKKADDLLDGAGNLKGAYAQELDYLATNNYKPRNITDAEWFSIRYWLGKPYIRNGARLEKVTVQNALNTHIKIAEKVSRDGVNGGHIESVFKSVALPNAGKRIEIISETPKSSIQGVKDITYKALAEDGKGNIIQGQYIQMSGTDKVFKKTVYDLSVYPDEVMEELGAKAFKDAMERNLFDTWGIDNRAFEGVVNGRTIYGHYEIINGEKVPKTWWIEK